MLLDHLRHARRLARRNPLLILGLLAILSGGIAVTTAVFGLVNVVWFRPSYPDAARLVVVHELHPDRGYSAIVSPAVYAAWSAGARSIDGIGAFEEHAFAAGSPGSAAERVRGVHASAAVLGLLAARPLAGRSWLSDEEAVGAPPVAVISQRYALLRFPSVEKAVGQTLRLDGVETTIVGVWPASFRLFNSGFHVFTPLLPADPSDPRPSLQVVARLSKGTSVDRAAAELSALARHATTRRAGDGTKAARAVPRPIDEVVWAGARPAYLLLLAAACLLLALVSANVSNLLIAHSAQRQREFAIRLALGAGRWGIVRQLLTEGASIALVAGAIALVVCSWLRNLLIASYPEMADLRLDPRVFAFTAAITLLAGLAFGLLPAFSVLRQDARVGLSAGRPAAPSRRRLGGILAVAQLGAAATLLIGCGLLVRSALDLRQTDPGFAVDRLLTASVSLPGQPYATLDTRLRFHQEAGARLRQIPGVVSAAVSSGLPLDGGVGSISFEVEGRGAKSAVVLQACRKAVDGGYFGTLGARRLAGDLFAEGEAAPVAAVNETLARALWRSRGAAVGSRIRIDGGEWRRVTGVVSDVRQELGSPASPEIYVPLAQADAPAPVFILRTSGEPTAVAPALRRAIAAIDPDLAVSDVWSMRSIVASYVPAPFIAAFGLLAAVSTLLGGLGLYALVSFQVTGRLREFAVRMALGADARRLMRLVLMDGLRLTATGLLAGMGGAAILGLALSRVLVGVRIVDPLVALAAAAGLAAVSLAACLKPARRATRVETAAVLRCE